MNRLDVEGLLPAEDNLLEVADRPRIRRQPRQRGRPPLRRLAPTIIGEEEQEIPWRADQSRIRAVWHELQTLDVNQHPNAISALLRILLELATESLLRNSEIDLAQGLSANFRRAADHLRQHDHIEAAYFDELERMRQHTELLSIPSMQRYVHSPSFAPLPDELLTTWMRLRTYVIACLTH